MKKKTLLAGIAAVFLTAAVSFTAIPAIRLMASEPEQTTLGEASETQDVYWKTEGMKKNGIEESYVYFRANVLGSDAVFVKSFTATEDGTYIMKVPKNLDVSNMIAEIGYTHNDGNHEHEILYQEFSDLNTKGMELSDLSFTSTYTDEGVAYGGIFNKEDLIARDHLVLFDESESAESTSDEPASESAEEPEPESPALKTASGESLFPGNIETDQIVEKIAGAGKEVVNEAEKEVSSSLDNISNKVESVLGNVIQSAADKTQKGIQDTSDSLSKEAEKLTGKVTKEVTDSFSKVAPVRWMKGGDVIGIAAILILLKLTKISSKKPH